MEKKKEKKKRERIKKKGDVSCAVWIPNKSWNKN